MKCPVCRALYRPAAQREAAATSTASVEAAPSTLCRRCGVDLTPLIRVHDQALWHYRQALHHLKQQQYAEAHAQTDQALALQQNADFYALSGRLWGLQGEFGRAVAAWQQARQLNPTHGVACGCLHWIAQLRQPVLQSSEGMTAPP